jgi:hypothetical protein
VITRKVLSNHLIIFLISAAFGRASSPVASQRFTYHGPPASSISATCANDAVNRSSFATHCSRVSLTTLPQLNPGYFKRFAAGRSLVSRNVSHPDTVRADSPAKGQHGLSGIAIVFDRIREIEDACDVTATDVRIPCEAATRADVACQRRQDTVTLV